MCTDHSGVGILNFTLGVIHELSGQQPMVKTIRTTKRLTFNKKFSTKNFNTEQGVSLSFFTIFGPPFFKKKWDFYYLKIGSD